MAMTIVAPCCWPATAKRHLACLYQSWSNGMKASTMLRSAAPRFTAEGRLLGFDTGDWSMLLGGFLLAGLLALMA
jgi:ABC-type glycerol-3-phosphate transport system permease component